MLIYACIGLIVAMLVFIDAMNNPVLRHEPWYVHLLAAIIVTVAWPFFFIIIMYRIFRARILG